MSACWPDAEFSTVAMADGGEGTVDAFLQNGAKRDEMRVHGPLGDFVDAPFAMQDRTATIELAAASGLMLVPENERDVLHSDTFGTGELIRAALDKGADRVIIGIGGSATNDAGTGLLRALGVRFIDEMGETLDRAILRYARLDEIDLRELDSRVQHIELIVAGDVDNPLCGPNGAARTFAAQKGANPAQIALLDETLEHIADIAASTLGRDARDAPGAGAAGGVGYALMEFLRARMERGAELIAKESKLPERLRDADLCVTGEGKIDDQTLHGKTVAGVAELAKAANVPVVAFGAIVEPGARAQLEARGITVREAGDDLEKAARDYAGELERCS